MESLPNWREKKEEMWGAGAAPEAQRERGEAFFRARRFSEALDYFERAGHADGFRRVLEEAVAEGDWFLFRRCRAYLGEPLEGELESLARNARERGKWLYALRASEALGDAASVEAARKALEGVFPDSEILLRELVREAPAEGGTEEEGDDGEAGGESPRKERRRR